MNDGGGAGGATIEAELDIENVLSLAPKANIEVYEGARQHLQRLQPDRQRRHGEDRQRQLDERLRGLCPPDVPERGEHPVPGGGRRRAVDLRRHGGPGLAGLQHQRCRLGARRAVIRWPRPSTPRRALFTSPTRPSDTVSVDSEGGANAPPHGPHGHDRVRVGPTPLRSLRRSARRSSPTRAALAHRGVDGYLQSSPRRLRLADAGPVEWPPQLTGGARRQRVHALRGNAQRHCRGLQRIDERLRGDGHPSVLLGAHRTGGRRHERRRLRRRPRSTAGSSTSTPPPVTPARRRAARTTPSHGLCRQHSRRPRSSQPAPATSTWLTPGAAEASR